VLYGGVAGSVVLKVLMNRGMFN